jgi:predicted cupin superfamily sugar epimerase
VVRGRGRGAGDFALVGCTVAPGFDFADFELGDAPTLLRAYPQHAASSSG